MSGPSSHQVPGALTRRCGLWLAVRKRVCSSPASELLQTFSKETRLREHGTGILSHTPLARREKFSNMLSDLEIRCQDTDHGFGFALTALHWCCMNRFEAHERVQWFSESAARVWRGAEAARSRFRIRVFRRHGLPALCASEEESYRIHLFCAVHSDFYTRMPAGEQTRACFVDIALYCNANDACSLSVHVEISLCICNPSGWSSCKA